MLSISTLPEALSALERRTGRPWTDSELFDLATDCGIELHAAVPITAKSAVHEFVLGEGMKKKYGLPAGHAVLAVLLPWQVGQLWISGETKTEFPSDHDTREGQYHWFTEPVRVTREQVRVRAETLRKVLQVWTAAQAGRWIKDAGSPGGMKYQHGPGWLFPPPPVRDGESTDTQCSRTWWEVASPYMIEKMKAGQFATAKLLYAALHAEAGTGQSPFDKGTGPHRGSLFVRDIAQPLALKTIQNNWRAIRDASAK